MGHPPKLASAAALLAAMETATDGGRVARNFVATVAAPFTPHTATIETPLFPAAALAFYSALNMGAADLTSPAAAAWYCPARGGPQGDYRAGMPAKLANVVDALRRFPSTKRAVLTVASRNESHEVDEDAKCLRELHFYVEADGRVHATGFMRAQAASIFPKNAHFIASVLEHVAVSLGREAGSYTHFVTTLTSGRE